MTENIEKTIHTSEPIKISQEAIDKIKSMMAKEGKEGYCLRIGVVTGGCAGLSYDLRFQKKAYDNDVVFQTGGITILINPDNLAFLNGTQIHYIDTLKESGFQYKNPNAQSSCGCGVSFSQANPFDNTLDTTFSYTIMTKLNSN